MTEISKQIIKILDKQQQDFDRRIAKGPYPLEALVHVREDWGVDRIYAILREAERLGIVFTGCSDLGVEAAYNGRELRGNIEYETRGFYYKTTRWTRPRMTLRLWITKHNDRIDAERGTVVHYRTGGEALAIIFGKERLMTYNRLMAALVQVI